MTRPFPAFLLAMAVVVSMSGCQANSSQPNPRGTNNVQPQNNWPKLLGNFRFHWSAEPGIDVITGPAMIVRAYMESFDTAWFTLDINNVFPGFTRSTPENQKRQGEFLWQLVQVRPLGDGYPKNADGARPHYGFQALHFLELAPLGDGYRAIVCSGEYAHFVESTVNPGKFMSIGVDDKTGRPFNEGGSGVAPYQIDLTQHDPRVGPNPPAPVTEPQRGPAPAPTQDVFGNWFITGASSSHWGPSTDRRAAEFPSPALQQRCEDAMPTPKAERLAMMTGFKDEPPPPGQAIPGWPAEPG